MILIDETKNLRELIDKYPLNNGDYRYMNNTTSLYNMIQTEYYKLKQTDAIDDYICELTMINLYNWYGDVREFFVCNVDTWVHDKDMCLLDPWNRTFPIYNSEVTVNNYSEYVNNGVMYTGGYVLKSPVRGIIICSVNITSVNSEPVFCLDLYL